MERLPIVALLALMTELARRIDCKLGSALLAILGTLVVIGAVVVALT